MDGERLAAALVERIGPLLPASVELVCVGDLVELNASDTKYPGGAARGLFDMSYLLASRSDLDEATQYACEQFLMDIQDFVVEATAEPWPGTGVMPNPSVTVTADEITLRFVHLGQVLVALPAIERATL